MKIHPTAIVDSNAILGQNVEVGPFAIVEADTEIGEGCKLLARSQIFSGTKLGPGCVVHPNAVVGGLPQDLSFNPETKSGLIVGSETVLRENCTVHRATREGMNTQLGSRCFIMGNAHIAHDCVVGDNVIMVNGALLAGHVTVGERVFVSGNSAVHQFARIGRLAMIGGLSRVGSDVPPFMLLELDNKIRGVNVVGIKRAGFSREQIDGVKAAYRLLYHEGLTFREAYERIEQEIGTPEALEIVEFCRATKRGLCRHFTH